MSHRTLRGLGRRRVAAGVAGSSLLLGLVAGVPAATAAPTVAPAAKPTPAPEFEAGRYIVLLDQLPTAAYDGRISGYPATKPAEGEKFDPDTAAAENYDDLLEANQDELLESVGVPESEVISEFSVVTNGFTVELSAREATALSRSEEVLSITEDQLLQPTTNVSPEFLGLTQEGGLFDQLGGVDSDGAGSGTVIGVVDSGIWPESRSFRNFDEDDRSRDEVAADYGYTGICDPGADGSFADACNNKLIGGRYYVEGFGVDNLAPQEFVSPRDAGGHGTHTASTAAGRHVEDVEVEGIEFGDLSGMAPGARLAAYKVCWDGLEFSGCFTSDSVSAINDAVADGVDAINYSISGTSDDYTAPVEIAFLNAAIANVFVAASSGNSGPAASTTNHPSPWLTTVAASTHKVLESTLELGNGERYVGASVTGGIGQTPTVLAAEAVAPGADPTEARLCFPGTLDSSVVTGKIVVCDRGAIARAQKSVTVRDAGGVGMILVNQEENSLNADLHVIPSIHLPVEVRDEIYAYVGGNPDATSAILAGVNEGSDTQVPEVVAFSSRGPSLGAGGDILKPDISAPGVDVLAAVVPFSNFGRDYDLYSGTSMSSPHIAGLSLLLREQHPEWTPAEQKSAMMTTAYDHASPTSAFAQGAGFVDPTKFSDPGLVYPAGVEDWASFLLGQGVDINFPGARPIEASDLNQASIAIGELVGTETVRRTVKGVGDSTAFYRAEVSGLEGIDVQVRPEQLVVSPGLEASYDVTFTYDGANLDEYAEGSLTWVSGDTEVEIPVVVNPVALRAPDEVSGEGTEGSLTYDVTAGVPGLIELTVDGLNEGAANPGNVMQGPVNPIPSPSTDAYQYEVPEGAAFARFDLNAASDSVDLDLYVLGPPLEEEDGPIQYTSASGAADERVDIVEPIAGTYFIFVNGFTAPPEGADYVLTNYAVQDSPVGNMTVDPETIEAEVSETYDITLTWSGLNEGPYLGLVNYNEPGDSTIVSIDAGPGDPGTPPPPGEEDPVVRHAGDDRYATSVDIGQAGYPDADTAVIVSGENTNLVDGLVAAPLAFSRDAPVLLTERDDLPDVVAADLQARGASAVTIIGGAVAVQPAVVAELEGMGIAVDRLAGANRWDTAALVAGTLGGEDTVVASGVEGTLMDALSAGGPAANGGWAILLTERDELPAATQAALEDRGGERVVVGGPMVVSDDIVAEIGATRAGGGDRYETATETSTFFADRGVPVASIVLASGEDAHIVDALAAGALGQLTVLTQQDDLPDATTSWITDRSDEINTVNIVGGELAVSEDVADEVRSILE